MRRVLSGRRGGEAGNCFTATARFLVLAVLVSVIGGCYAVEQEVILASDAEDVYGLPGNYTWSGDDAGKTTISAVPDSNDYRFRTVSDDDVESGYLRAINLRGDIYVIQVKYDDDPDYYIAFYEFSYGDFTALDIDESTVDLAHQSKVEIEYDYYYYTDWLVGSRRDILNFLLAHEYVDLSSNY